MRKTFIDELIHQTRLGSNNILVVGDLGYNVIEPFQNEFPERFFNSGVAEQNMMGFSAGIASEGQRVFVYSIANFPTFRCAEQIRNDVAYHNLPVTIVAVGGGLSYGNMGYSHHAVQDYSLMRSFPNMRICAPGDPLELKSIMKIIANSSNPYYLRLGRGGEKVIHNSEPTIIPGNWLELLSSKNNKIFLSTGAALPYAKELIENNKSYSDYGLFSLPIWGIDLKLEQKEFLEKYKEIIIIEDHLVDGGFGSWILEGMYESNMTSYPKIQLLGLDKKVTGLVGSQDFLNRIGWNTE